jgi:hypothetical protein
MAAHELIDEAYLRVANRGNQPDKDAQLAGLVLLVEALRSLPDDPDERQAELARVRHPRALDLFGDFLPGTGAARRGHVGGSGVTGP